MRADLTTAALSRHIGRPSCQVAVPDWRWNDIPETEYEGLARWHEQIGDPTLADGILDRLVHNAHRIEMRGDSMRKNRGKARG